MVAEHIALRILRPFEEIDPPHIFPPTDDLPDEPFHRIERRLPVFPRILNGLACLQRVQQPRIEV